MLKSVPLSKVYRLIEPGPVVLVTTAYKGQANIMTLSYHMMLCHQPPVTAIDLGPWNHSFKALRATKECVIAIPTVDLASKAVEIGNCSGEDIDKFKTFGLTPVPAKKQGQKGSELFSACGMRRNRLRWCDASPFASHRRRTGVPCDQSRQQSPARISWGR